jgi:hypothetical protein
MEQIRNEQKEANLKIKFVEKKMGENEWFNDSSFDNYL